MKILQIPSILFKKGNNPLSIFFIFYIFICTSFSYGQELVVKQSSDYTYIFKINNDQALQLYKEVPLQLDASYFTQFIDSFPIAETYTKTLPQGHYIQTSAKRNLQESLFTSVQDFDVFVLNNAQDLIIQVRDVSGNILTNAKVYVDDKRIKFEAERQAYFEKKSNAKGLLSVEIDGFTGYYALHRTKNSSFLSRASRQLAYQYPTKYLWLPIEFIAMLPVDGVKSIQEDYSVGKVRTAENIFNRLVCLFDSDHYKCRSKHNFKQNKKPQKAYFAINKPKFRPGDTLKGKFFVWSHKAKPLNETLFIELEPRRGEAKLIKSIKPYRNGAYHFELILNDSLDLTLDQHYTIYIKTNKDKYVTSTSFQYEAYELTNHRLELYTDQKEYYRGEEIVLSLDAFDANEHRLQDAKVKIVAKSRSSNLQTADKVFIPDTLWQHELNLLSKKTTKVSLPDSIFTSANIAFTLHALLQSSDFDTTSEQLDLSFIDKTQQITHTLQGDSILVGFQQNGKNITKEVKVEATDFFGNPLPVLTETTPFAIAIEPFYNAYLLSSGEYLEEVQIDKLDDGIMAQLSKEKDSIFINVLNPKKLFFNYSIFRKNKEVESGFDTKLRFETAEEKDISYYLNLNYLWGGKNKERNFVLPIHNKDLQVKVNQPTLVYPGKKTTIEVEVNDYQGKPVANADILAYGFNYKFNQRGSSVERFSDGAKPRKLRNSFKVDKSINEPIIQDLNLAFWNDLEELSQKEYYQLSYPGDSLYVKQFPINNGPTQFAPFVTENGKFIPVHILKVNNKPVYFSDMSNVQPYSFAVEEHPVHIEMRTKNKLIYIDSISFKPQHKSIISLDVHAKNKSIRVVDAPSSLFANELSYLHNYVLAYRLRHNTFSYLENQDRIHLLQQKKNHFQSTHFVGPIVYNAVRFVNNTYELDFNFDRGYYYQFLPKHLKQTQLSLANYPTFLENQEIPNFYDLVFTKEQVAVMTKQQMNKIRSNSDLIRYPYRSDRAKASLQIEHVEPATNLYIVNLETETEARIYKGNTTKIYNLTPGKYRLFVLYPDEKYRLVDDLDLRADGTTYFKLSSIPKLKGDTFSSNFAELIEAHFLRKDNSKEASRKTQQGIRQNYNAFQSFFGDHYLFEGSVKDANLIPLPGVDISIAGTSYGTRTDFDGYFQLRVPVAYSKVKFNYVGYISQEFTIKENTFKNIELIEDVMELNDVVVTAYGSNNNLKRQQAYVNSEISALQNDDVGYISNADVIQLLQGRIAGVNIYNDLVEMEEVADISFVPGASTTIIRGRSSLSSISGQPLIIINGVPFQGDLSSISPNQIKNMTVLKDASATAIYGSRGSNGVILINTQQQGFQVEETEEVLDEEFIANASQANSLRNNFNDEAFWQPQLNTNEEGKVTFSVTYPDNVTSWDTHFLVATQEQQTGQFKQNVKSFKPLMAQLNIPRFLVEGDSVQAIGKLRNYIKDTLEVESQFLINEQLQFSKTHQIGDFISEKLNIVPASTDSLSIIYQLSQTNTDYFDGEQLTIPVFQKGMKKAEGEFFVVPKDEVVSLSFTNRSEKVKLRLDASLPQLLEEELNIVINYHHECNEQLASRLKAELIKREIYQVTQRKLSNEKQINGLIKDLVKNQQKDNLWGWWASSETNWWVSLQVVEALLLAKNKDFKVNIDFQNLQLQLENELFTSELNTQQIQKLQVLDALGSTIDFKAIINKLLQDENISVLERFQLWELLQKHGGQVNWKKLETYQKETIVGNIYFSAEELPIWHPFQNQVQLSLMAYRMLRLKGEEQNKLDRLRNYLLSHRSHVGFANTFESMSVIATLLEDISWDASTEVEVQIKINDAAWQVVQGHISELEVNSSDRVQIKHNSSLPIYVNYSQSYWEANPLPRKEEFEVNTYFTTKLGDKIPTNVFKAGDEVSIFVEVNAFKQADYVMLEVPIPSGTSYANKMQFPNDETHRSYAKDKTFIFIEHMPEGVHTFEVQLMPRYQGSYTLNPATAKLMYFEQFYGNNQIKRCKIE